MTNPFWTPHDQKLRLPLIGAPMFLVSGKELVIAQCRAGIIGTLPALNARTPEELDDWLAEIHDALLWPGSGPSPAQAPAPCGVNLIVHRTNASLDQHLDLCVKYRLPVVITSFGCRPDVNEAIHAYGGIVLHDVTNLEHARKAIERGANGLIAVAVGAGGHAGRLSPISLVEDIRRIWNGPLVLSGAVSSGRGILAAQAMGADMTYMGTRFIVAKESMANQEYRDMIAGAEGADIVYTDKVSGTSANFLSESLERAGISANDAQPELHDQTLDQPKAWRDIWSAGQGVGPIFRTETTEAIVAQLEQEYSEAAERIAALQN